eukprot:2404443-Amphidinium_carterae.1
MYLESIFGAGDIKKQLPTESTKFMEIDKEWRSTTMPTKAIAKFFVRIKIVDEDHPQTIQSWQK